jgi:hypothetical protein
VGTTWQQIYKQVYKKTCLESKHPGPTKKIKTTLNQYGRALLISLSDFI